MSAKLGAGPQGSGFSSAEAALFGQVKENYDKRRKELGERLSNAFQKMDLNEIERVQARIDHLDDIQMKREQQMFDRFIALRSEDRASGRYGMEALTFDQKQEDRQIESVVGTIVALDENGEIVRPDDDTLKAFALKSGIDPAGS